MRKFLRLVPTILFNSFEFILLAIIGVLVGIQWYEAISILITFMLSRNLLYAGVALATPKMEEMFNQYKDNSIIQALEIVREDGTINVDALYNAMKHAMNKMGTVEYMGIKFNSDDVDKLYNYIHTA